MVKSLTCNRGTQTGVNDALWFVNTVSHSQWHDVENRSALGLKQVR